jgi:hypothetical protein
MWRCRTEVQTGTVEAKLLEGAEAIPGDSKTASTVQTGIFETMLLEGAEGTSGTSKQHLWSQWYLGLMRANAEGQCVHPDPCVPIL